MKNKFFTTILCFLASIASGYALYQLLKRIGLGDTFDFNLFEDIDLENE
jgi:hypothetical protein